MEQVYAINWFIELNHTNGSNPDQQTVIDCTLFLLAINLITWCPSQVVSCWGRYLSCALRDISWNWTVSAPWFDTPDITYTTGAFTSFDRHNNIKLWRTCLGVHLHIYDNGPHMYCAHWSKRFKPDSPMLCTRHTTCIYLSEQFTCTTKQQWIQINT